MSKKYLIGFVVGVIILSIFITGIVKISFPTSEEYKGVSINFCKPHLSNSYYCYKGYSYFIERDIPNSYGTVSHKLSNCGIVEVIRGRNSSVNSGKDEVRE